MALAVFSETGVTVDPYHDAAAYLRRHAGPFQVQPAVSGVGKDFFRPLGIVGVASSWVQLPGVELPHLAYQLYCFMARAMLDTAQIENCLQQLGFRPASIGEVAEARRTFRFRLPGSLVALGSRRLVGRHCEVPVLVACNEGQAIIQSTRYSQPWLSGKIMFAAVPRW